MSSKMMPSIQFTSTTSSLLKKKSLAIRKMVSVAKKPMGMSRRMDTRVTSMGQIMALTPRMSRMFIVLLPTMLPMARPGLPLAHENTLTIISGNEVPKATMVRPMMSGDSLARMPMLVAPLTSQFAPKIKAAKPMANNIKGIIEVICLVVRIDALCVTARNEAVQNICVSNLCFWIALSCLLAKTRSDN